MPEEYPDLLEILSLHMASGIGWRLYQKLETAFGSARAILNAPQSRLESIPGIGPVRSKAILDQRSMNVARQEVELARQHGVTILDYYNPDYPFLLQQTSDPPLILYVKGTLLPEDSNGLSIVGTRQCSMYGRDTARKFARELAQRGLTVVSGLAKGIDTAAHQGALDGGGRTLAVLGSGLLKIYPQENDSLQEQICSEGAVLSEFPLNMPAAADHFPRRNRIIAWLTRASLVVEGDEKSGSMITARYANEEGRTVLALPGRIDSSITRGPHSLIRDGATLVRGLDDILEVLKLPYLPTPGPVARQRLRQEVADNTGELAPEGGSAASSTASSPAAAARPAQRAPRSPAAPNAPNAAASADETVAAGSLFRDTARISMPRPSAPAGSAAGTASPASPGAKAPAKRNALSPAHAKIFEKIPPHDPIGFEALLQATGLQAGELSAALIVLEVRGQVRRLPGPEYERGA